jgi:hypothetical protein
MSRQQISVIHFHFHFHSQFEVFIRRLNRPLSVQGLLFGWNNSRNYISYTFLQSTSTQNKSNLILKSPYHPTLQSSYYHTNPTYNCGRHLHILAIFQSHDKLVLNQFKLFNFSKLFFSIWQTRPTLPRHTSR